MDPRESQELPQRLTLENRQKLTVTGVLEAVSFDPNAAVLHTVRGTLLIRGQELHLRQLTADGGQVTVEGQIDAMLYEEARQEGGFLSRLFG